MSLLAKRREFLAVYRRTGSVEAAAAELKLEPSQHTEWMQDWLYRGAFAEVQKELKGPPPPPVEKKRLGRPPKPKPENPPPKRPPGRPRKNPPPSGSPGEPVASNGAEKQEAINFQPETTVQDAPGSIAEAPVMVGHTFAGNKGYVRLYTPEGEVPSAPDEPRKAPEPRRPIAPEPEPALEVTVASDEQQRAMIDEYGELDRRMQLRATDTARYEALKKAIKSWFGAVPPDADGTVEGEVYLLHLSACERERKIRSVRELVDQVGLDQVLDLAVVPIGALENLLGKTRVAGMTVETRTGSRRIKAIPKRPAGVTP